MFPCQAIHGRKSIHSVSIWWLDRCGCGLPICGVANRPYTFSSLYLVYNYVELQRLVNFSALPLSWSNQKLFAITIFVLKTLYRFFSLAYFRFIKKWKKKSCGRGKNLPTTHPSLLVRAQESLRQMQIIIIIPGKILISSTVAN